MGSRALAYEILINGQVAEILPASAGRKAANQERERIARQNPGARVTIREER